MATYLYCVRSDPVAPSHGLVGIDDARVRALEVDDLLAWVCAVAVPSLDASVDRVRAHDAVCAAALEDGDTPLPVRFGQTFADDRDAVAGIATRAAELRTRLARIAGCVEMRVVIARGRTDASPAADDDGGTMRNDAAGEDHPEGPGTAFLRRLARAGRADLAREIGCEEVRHALRATAGSLVVEQHGCETARGLAFFAVLVRRADASAFRRAVANTLPSQAIDVAVLGPFAPYTFSGDA